jgi:hypothetical protein
MNEATQNPLLEVADLLILSLWVAICAVTPEFIWRGAHIALEHVDESTIASALLFGLILAFCIEPALERLRHRLGRSGHRTAEADMHEEPPSLLFTAGVGLVFAIVSICLHDSISAFLGNHEGAGTARHFALINGLEIAAAWAIVPFCVTLAWIIALTTIRPWRWVVFILAALSPPLAGWVFSWEWQDWVTAALPALAILTAGWRQARDGDGAGFFRRAAASLCWIAMLWLAAAALFSFIANAFGLGSAALYTPAEFWIDARFYLGWAAGLLIVPDLPRVQSRR